MANLRAEVDKRIDATRLSPQRRTLLRDFLLAAIEADAAVDIRLGDAVWAALEIYRSGRQVARVFTNSGKVQINNFLPKSTPDDYGANARLNDLGQWSFFVKTEADTEIMLRCLADNIAHLGGRMTFRPTRPSGVPRSAADDETLRRISRSLRLAVLIRDDYTCQYCGRRAPLVILHVDHRIPYSKGGKTVLENLIAACNDCNLGKSDRYST